MSKGKRVIFLDRDGTINVDHDQGYVYKREDWKFIDGAVEGMDKLSDAGYTLTVVTNQSGIGHELYVEEDMHTLHTFMKHELRKSGVVIAAIAFAPETREANSHNRKPNIGMAKQIEAVIGDIDYANSWVIGDKEADIGFGQGAGTKSVLIRSKHWKKDELEETPDFIAGSLFEAAEHIVKNDA